MGADAYSGRSSDLEREDKKWHRSSRNRGCPYEQLKAGVAGIADVSHPWGEPE